MAENVRYTKDKDDYIKAHFGKDMTAEQIAQALGVNKQTNKRAAESIRNRAKKLGLKATNVSLRTGKKKGSRSSFIGTLTDSEKKKEFQREVRESSRYKTLLPILNQDELNLYVEKYVDFMMDPTIETMTTMEKDALHQLFLNDIRILRFMKEEKDDEPKAIKEKRAPISRNKEIKECQEMNAKYHKSLDVEREQRLKNMNDQSITFTNLIRDLKNPNTRMKAGCEAAVLKYITEMSYNNYLGKNIFSGKEIKFDIDANFRGGVAPSGFTADFTPHETKE